MREALNFVLSESQERFVDIDPRIAPCPIVAAPRDQPHAIPIAFDAEAVAIIFDLAKPVRAVRR